MVSSASLIGSNSSDSDTTNVAIVTGGTSGLGKSIARLLARSGKAICLVARGQDRLVQTLRDFAEEKTAALALCADVSIAADVRNIRTLLASRNLRVSEVYNVAGTGLFGPLGSTSDADLSRVIATNLMGPILLVREFLEDVKAERGTIVNVISRCALRGIANEAVYSSSKWGLRGFSEALRVELADTGVRVISVYCGGMKTNFWTEWRDHHASSSYQSFMDADEVAQQIVSAANAGHSCAIQELNIARRA